MVQHTPLVSVIIPCYNHGQYLYKAVTSVKEQGYPAIEIIVVDDGSVDNTKVEAENLPEVHYIYQENKGLSAARNTGISYSEGEFLVFLDADDWLLPGAITTNINYLLQNEQVAFVSGGHEKVFVDEGWSRQEAQEVKANHYLQLLQGNYIGMHATVMYRSWVFDDFSFDESLKNCEDYDLYFKIARKYPVLHHTKIIAAYRLHTTNMSGNIPAMLQGVLKVLKRQKTTLLTYPEKQAYKKGVSIWKHYYCLELYRKLLAGYDFPKKQSLYTIFSYQPVLGIKYLFKKYIHA